MMQIVQLRKYKNQFFSTALVNTFVLCHGIATGWISPILPILQSDDSPLTSGRISVDEASWIGSLVCLGGLTGNIIFGLIIDVIGRKKTLCVVPVPHILFWITVRLGTRVEHLYIGRFLAGITGGGLFLTAPIYISEIANSEIRGTLGSMFILFLNTGIMIGYVLSSYLSYNLIPLIIVGIPILCSIVVACCLPETAQYLLKKNQEEKAQESLKFYQNYKAENKEDVQNFERTFDLLKKISNPSGNTNNQQRLSFKDFVTPEARKGFLIGVLLMGLNQFSGSFAIINYSANILENSGAATYKNIGTIIVGVTQIIGTGIATVIVDSAGRKILLTISTSGVALGHLALGTFSYFVPMYDLSEWDWVPVLCLSFIIFTATLGIIPLPLVVTAEVLPQKILALSSAVLMVCLSSFAFLVLKVMPILMEFSGLSNVLWMCAGISLCGTFLLLKILPETKGKVLQ